MKSPCPWVVESAPFPATASRLVAALERAGSEWTPYDEDHLERLPAAGARAVFYGSLNVGVELARSGGWTAGVLCDVERLHCSAYYPHFESLLLNTGAVFTTVRSLVADPLGLAGALASEGRVFVRPDSPLKQFAGRVVELRDLSPARLDHGYYYDDLDLPIVVSPLRDVGSEWRFVAARGRVVTGCAYDPEGRSAAGGDIPHEVLAVAEQAARSAWTPDPIFVVDVCQTPDGPRLLELNSFSCSDLYACDYDEVVEAVEEFAKKTPGPRARIPSSAAS